MGRQNNSTIEYYEKKNTAEAGYNRKNVNTIKKMIILFIAIMCIVPVVLCIYLMSKMSKLEQKMDDLAKSIAMKRQEMAIEEEVIYATSDEDLLILDQEAATDININEAENVSLSTPEENEEGDTPAANNITTEDNGLLNRNNNGKKVYLTFDDGPSIYTDDILDILDEKNVKATFFVVYHEDETLWDEYSRIVEDGHTLAMHSYTHVYDEIYASQEAFEEDVTKIHDFLYEQTGVDCTYYRFPGGSSNNVSNVEIQDLMGYLDEEGYTYYDWNALSEDSVNMYLTPEELNENVMGYVRSNQGDSIVLLHDLENNPATMEGLPDLIDTLIEEGYEICAIDETTVPVQHRTYIKED